MIRVTILISAIACGPLWVQQESGPNSQNEKRLAKISEYIGQGGSLYKEGDFAASGRKITAAQALLSRAVREGTEDIREQVEKEHRRIAKAHELLTAKGIELADLQPLPEVIGQVEDPVMEATTGGDSEAEMISFKDQVAPLLNQRCGTCHVRGSRGDYNLGTYAKLMGGFNGDETIVAGHPQDGLIFQVIDDGKMPPSRTGQKLPDDEIALIRDWILQGAQFDGDDETASIGGRPPGSRGNR